MKRPLLLFSVPFIIVAFISFVIFQKACDLALSTQAEKFLPFNHQDHLPECDARKCETCHKFYENGRFVGSPTVAECKDCHDGDHAGELEALNRFRDTDKPWEVYAKQPDLVYFSHTVVQHSPKKVGCVDCHGDKANSTTTEKIKGKVKMGKCMDCHDALEIDNSCLVCHK